MSCHYVTINQHINITDYNMISTQYMTRISDILYGLCPNVKRGDTIRVNSNMVFGFDGIRLSHVHCNDSYDKYIHIPVGNDLPINTFIQHDNTQDHILLDISYVRDEMLSTLTPFYVDYKGQRISFVTSNPQLTYDKVKTILETSYVLLVGYENGKLIYCDIDHDFHISNDMLVHYDDEENTALVKWNDMEFNIVCSNVMYIMQ